MNFKIIGNIENEEAFASGSGIREISPVYAGFMVKDARESGKESPILSSKMELRSK